MAPGKNSAVRNYLPLKGLFLSASALRCWPPRQATYIMFRTIRPMIAAPTEIISSIMTPLETVRKFVFVSVHVTLTIGPGINTAGQMYPVV
jgi:hypothetical protein